MNGLAGGVIPKPFSANNPSDEGKFLASVHPSCEFDAPSALDELAINYLESMSCNNDDDLYCNIGVKHSAEEIFNVQTGPVQNWTFGPDNWVVDGQSNFLTIPKSGSIIPQYVN